MTDRIPPHDDEMERSVLGAMLLDKTAAAIAVEMLRPEDFYSGRHAETFRTAAGLLEERGALDAALLRGALRPGPGEGVAAYIAGLMSAAGTSANVEHYARAVLDASERRAVIRAAHNAIAEAQDTATDMEAVRERAGAVAAAVAGRADEAECHGWLDAGFDWIEHPDRRPRAGSKLADLDGLLAGGIAPGELCIVGGRTGAGKSALCAHIALEAARRGRRVSWWSLEMTAAQMSTRWISMQSGVPLFGRDMDALAPKDATALERARAELEPLARLIRVDARTSRLAAISAACTSLAGQDRLGLVVVDYAQLVESPGEKREQQVAAVSRAMKRVARRYDAPVLLAAQLNRLAANDEPQVHHLRESGALEQDADTVLLLWRTDEEPHVLNCKVAKNRSGPTGLARVRADLAVMRFSPLWLGEVPAAAAAG